MATFHIVGDIFVDLFCFLEGNWPELGGDANLAHPVSTMAGGSALNTATHLNSLVRHFMTQKNNDSGALFHNDVILQSMINPHDAYGKIILKHTQEQGFPIINCQKVDGSSEDDLPSTGHCMCIVANGDRTFMTHNGAMSLFGADTMKSDQIASESTHVHLHVAGYYNIPGFWNGKLKERLQSIRNERKEQFPEKCTTISINPQYDASDKWDGGIDELFPLLDFAIMNNVEASKIVSRGMRDEYDGGEDEDDSNPQLQKWVTHFGRLSETTTFVITRGKMGAIAIRGGKTLAQQSAVSVNVIDPTGAGDSFAAGFLHGIWSWRQQNDCNSNHLSPWPVEAIQEGLLWGCSVGSAAVQIRGASVPATPDEIQSFHDRGREL